MGTMTVLNPTTETKQSESIMAPRLSTLDGKILGIINNGKRNSDVFLTFLINKLKDRYQLKDVMWFDKSSGSTTVSQSVLEQLKEANAVIAGVGD